MREKPIVAIKVGRSQAGRDAVASHTGALAGRDDAYSAAFRKAGVIRAESSEEMFDWARALAWCPLPRGRQMAVLTNAGGPGAIAADALEANGLKLATLSETTRQTLRGLLPAAASVRNPVDALASAGPAEFANCLAALLRDEDVDGVMVILPPPPMSTAAEVVGAIIPMVRTSVKPVVISLMGEDLIAQAARLCRQAHVPDYRFPERAASALRALAIRAEQMGAAEGVPAPLGEVQKDVAAKAFRSAEAGAGGFLSTSAAAQIVSAYGLRTPRGRLARTAEEAARAAEEIGYPVALKVDSPDMAHKSDVGGVALGLTDGASVAEAFRRVTEASRASHPDARIEGVLVQEQISGGLEVIVGVVRDDQFGPLVMFGSGGVEVEGLKDVAFALAPLSREEAEEMIDLTWAGRRLRGFRNQPPGDREAVIDVIRRIGQLAVDFPEVTEAEVNPLRVLEVGRGAVALDTRIRIRPTA
jgi:acetyltransferase